MFIHLHLASHLGMLDEPREGHDGGPIVMMEGLHKCCELGCRQANLTDLCQIPGKPRSILSLVHSLFTKAQEYNFI